MTSNIAPQTMVSVAIAAPPRPHRPDPAGPWGGVKSSGLGRELSPGAIAAYQNLKTVDA